MARVWQAYVQKVGCGEVNGGCDRGVVLWQVEATSSSAEETDCFCRSIGADVELATVNALPWPSLVGEGTDPSWPGARACCTQDRDRPCLGADGVNGVHLMVQTYRIWGRSTEITDAPDPWSVGRGPALAHCRAIRCRRQHIASQCARGVAALLDSGKGAKMLESAPSKPLPSLVQPARFGCVHG